MLFPVWVKSHPRSLNSLGEASHHGECGGAWGEMGKCRNNHRSAPGPTLPFCFSNPRQSNHASLAFVGAKGTAPHLSACYLSTNHYGASYTEVMHTPRWEMTAWTASRGLASRSTLNSTSVRSAFRYTGRLTVWPPEARRAPSVDRVHVSVDGPRDVVSPSLSASRPSVQDAPSSLRPVACQLSHLVWHTNAKLTLDSKGL